METNDQIFRCPDLLEESLRDYALSVECSFADLKKTNLFVKIHNERAIRKLSEEFFKKLEPLRSRGMSSFSDKEKEQLKRDFREFALVLDKQRLFFDKPFLGYFMEMGYLESTNAFFDAAKSHDENLLLSDLFQAVRNLWIMNSLQILFGGNVSMTPSTFSYSMLYPYTDNYLDDPRVDKSAKKKFNERFQMVLEGNQPKNVTPEEMKIFTMIRNIEAEYDRSSYGELYESLLAIQHAQVFSMGQDGDTKLVSGDLLPLSFYKGGCSVLADAFLVRGHLSIAEKDFAFGYGCFLQLLDDFQDTSLDREDRHWTLFSISEKHDVHDKNVEKLLAFIHRVMTKHTLNTANEVLLKKVIPECTMIMVMDVIGRDPSLVSRKFYHTLESYSKVRLSFYKELKEKIDQFTEGLDRGASIGKYS